MTNRQLIFYWKKNFQDSGLLPELISEYISYITPLVKHGVPIIFDFNHLCLLLGRKPSYLATVINASSHHYREFKISKKSGGERTISAPYFALMGSQYWIYQNILKKIKIHPAAQGFTFNKSIITNATVHLDQPHFLKIDLKDFFPSIKIEKVIMVFKSLGYNHKVAYYLSAICCLDSALPQGAPTSPILSNIICHFLDKRLFSFAKKFQLKYTRYADDLAFSGPEIPVKFIEYISKIIVDCGFSVNDKKTLLHHKKGKRILTGISIAERQLKIPKDYKRSLKQEVYYIQRYGIVSHVRRRKIKNPEYLFSIIGKLQFWLSVEPDNKFAKDSLQFFTQKGEAKDSTVAKPKKIFISYSKTDQVFLREFKMHISSLIRQGLVTSWDDSLLEPGVKWDTIIKNKLEDADIILCMLSPDFISNKYIWDIEITRALSLDKDKIVVPIFISPCDYSGTIFADLLESYNDEHLPEGYRKFILENKVGWLGSETLKPKRDLYYKQIVELVKPIIKG